MNRQRFALPRPPPILLLSLLVLCASVTWAQRAPLARPAAIQFSKPAVSLPAAPEPQARPFSFPKEMFLSFPLNLGQAKPGLKFVSPGAGYDFLLPTNTPAMKLSAEANWIARPPETWRTNLPENEHLRMLSPHDLLHYYGQHLPLVGQTILHVARLVDSHPRVMGVLQLLINRPKHTSSGAPRIRANF
jgi:uncharacterized iron-regulated membrane protein